MDINIYIKPSKQVKFLISEEQIKAFFPLAYSEEEYNFLREIRFRNENNRLYGKHQTQKNGASLCLV